MRKKILSILSTLLLAAGILVVVATPARSFRLENCAPC